MADPTPRVLDGGVEVWVVDEGDAWKVWCMECGFRLGTTTNPDLNARESDAARLTRAHRKTMHL